mmetsp:Transcript_6977/g.14107  ORF Transcript_6977/g.14107 Transcript_6977/m.14107 type:complete len:221 (+) Transcript_6977:344-1006(+)
MTMQTTPIVSTATLPRVTSGSWDCDGDWDWDRSSSSSSSSSLPSSAVSLALASRRTSHMRPANGSKITTVDGTSSHAIVFITVILSAIHNIVVVTSPTGLHAPPAFAAMTMTPPMLWRRCLSLPTACRSNFKQTMVAVKLSITALRKKQRKPRMGMRGSFRPLASRAIAAVTTAKPPKWSIDSTTPMAGSKKRIIAPTSCKPWSSSSSKASWPSVDSWGW